MNIITSITYDSKWISKSLKLDKVKKNVLINEKYIKIKCNSKSMNNYQKKNKIFRLFLKSFIIIYLYIFVNYNASLSI